MNIIDRLNPTSRVNPLAAPRDAAPDPVIALYRQFLKIEAASRPFEVQCGTLRDELVAEYGAPNSARSTLALWGCDPRYSAMADAVDTFNTMHSQQWEVADQILETPATTQAGALAKLEVALQRWNGWDLSEEDQHIRAMYTSVEDAIRVLKAGGLS